MSDSSSIHGLSRSKAAEGVAVPEPPRRWRERLLVPLVLVVTVLSLLAYSAWDLLLPAAKVRVAPVLVKSVLGEIPGTVTVQAPGWVEPDPHPTEVSTLTSGVVESLHVLEGDRVEAGQIVAELIDEDAVIQREFAVAMLEQRLAATLKAEANCTAARKELETLVRPNEALEKAKAALSLVDAERVQLEERIEAADADARTIQDEYDRKQRLVASEAVSRGEVERLGLKLKAARAQLAALRSEIDIVKSRREGAVAHLRASERSLELKIVEQQALALAEAELRASKAAEAAAEAALAEAELRLDRAKVRAPVGGVVMRRLVSPGKTLHTVASAAHAVLVELYDPDRLQVRVDVPLVDAAQVGVGQKAKVVVDALRDREFDGVVTRLVHYADLAKNTVEVKVAIENPSAVLKPEMLARVRFLAVENTAEKPRERQRLFAPRSALRGLQGQSAKVLVVTDARGDRGRVELRDLTVGTLVLEDHIEVIEGLRPGDRVLLDAPADLVEGDLIEIVGGQR